MDNKTKLEKNKDISDGDGKTVSAIQPEVFEIPVNEIVPSPFEAQARRRMLKFETDIGQERINELGDSILENGLLQPIRVRRVGSVNVRRVGTVNEIVYGERRWLAHLAKGLPTIFCFVSSELSDAETLKLQYFENHDRDEPDALEDALRFKYLIDHENYTEEKIASEFATTKTTVKRKIRLNKLIPDALAELSDGLLPLKHAYYLATFPAESQKQIVEREYAYEWRGKEHGAITFDEFKQTVEENIVRDLATAPFDTNDPSLHVTGLICSRCPQQTGFNKTLFEDDFKGEKCLNPACFAVKINTYARHQQQELAEEMIATKTPDEVSGELPEETFEKVLKSVPLVTENSTVNKKDLSIKGTVLTDQELHDEPECEYSVKALAVDGPKKNQKVYVCQNEKCPTHHPEKISAEEKSGPTDYELQQFEKRFQIQVAMTVRKKVLLKSIEHFDGYNSFWQNADLVEKLLVEFIRERSFHVKQHLDIFSIFKNFPKDVSHTEATQDFVRGLDPRQRDQLLFLVVFSSIGFMTENSTGFISQNDIEQIAKSYAKVNYGALDADVRVELAPDEFKEVAEEYRRDFRGEGPAVVPRFWWNDFVFPD